MADAPRLAEAPGLRRELSLFDGVAIVAGTVIGSGIFIIPSSIAADLRPLGSVLLVWIAGGLLTVFGALSLAELGSMYPGAGGLCTYLRRAYGPLPAFLYAWGLLFMIHSGSIAALAVGFGIYAAQVLPLGLGAQKAVSVGCIVVLTAINCIGVRGGKRVQNTITVAKLGGLAAIILLIGWGGSRPLRLFPAAPAAANPPLAGFGVALIAVLWAYEGWHIISFVAGEMKAPQRDLPRSLLYGTALVLLIYVVANLGYYHILSYAQIRGSSAVAALAVQTLLGPAGRITVSVLVLISLLGSTNGLVLTGPRVYFAMAQDRAFPAVFGRLHPRYRTPTLALVVQGVWAAVLAAVGSYEQLFTDVIFTAWIFYGLAVAAVVVLRRRRPELERPFRVPGYPWLPLLFTAAALGLVGSTVVARPFGALAGLGLLAAGIPVYFFLVKAPAES